MKQFVRTLLLILLCSQSANAQVPDVHHYHITFDTINFSSKTIGGHCELLFTPDPAKPDTVLLQLLGMTIDSVIGTNGQTLNYQYNDTNLIIQLPPPPSASDTIPVTVYYRGAPRTDPSGWGGFYFSGNYAFNLGVGFESDPHNFGRAWFPCVDNFTDRAKYFFTMTVPGGYKAFCNGLPVADSILPDGRHRWHWYMKDPIPTYLASVAIAPYYTWERNYQNLPVQIACMPQDSGKVSSTFIHLDTVLHHFITAYGPYRFDKVGYCLVPFNSGAMEHATSIHIGRAYIDGSLSYETLWAHELAHMWWGDWVTCETAGDMWLNEGFASFNEAFMTEKLYGRAAYRDWLRSNHRRVLQFAHHNDNAYLPLVNIPHEHTYGQTVYNKGADVAHTLRSYMGDSLFFTGCRAYMDSLGNGSANSYDFRDRLSLSTGLDMTRFFDDWVFTPGFPHFSIDSVRATAGPGNTYTLFTRQRSKGNNHLYEMPVEITASNGVQDTTFILLFDSLTNIHSVQLSFQPEWFAVDRNEMISDAVSDREKKVYQTGQLPFEETNVTLNVLSSGTDTSMVRIEHHFTAPDPLSSPGAGIRISDYHYWSFDGIIKPGFAAKANFAYNGTNSGTAGFLDNTLITGTEDSLVLLYRRSCAETWAPAKGQTLLTGSKFDKIGQVAVDTLFKGEYALGYRVQTTGTGSHISVNSEALMVWPNPAENRVKCSVELPAGRRYLLVINTMDGKSAGNLAVNGQETIEWTPPAGLSGTFVFTLLDGRREICSRLVQFIR